MKIYFIGLSSFIIENAKGYRILIDPFMDTPEWTLGPKFPKKFKGKKLGVNMVLTSEPDADHTSFLGNVFATGLQTRPKSNPFPGLDLRGTVVYEYNGDVNIAWHYTVDGIRLAHFADNAHVLTAQQCKEFGHPDIVFMSPPKSADPKTNNIIRKNISLLQPKIVIWAHHIAPMGVPYNKSSEEMEKFFIKYFKKRASTNLGYKNEGSFIQLCYILKNAIELTREYEGTFIDNTELTVTRNQLHKKTNSPKVYLFQRMLAK